MWNCAHLLADGAGSLRRTNIHLLLCDRFAINFLSEALLESRQQSEEKIIGIVYTDRGSTCWRSIVEVRRLVEVEACDGSSSVDIQEWLQVWMILRQARKIAAETVVLGLGISTGFPESTNPPAGCCAANYARNIVDTDAVVALLLNTMLLIIEMPDQAGDEDKAFFDERGMTAAAAELLTLGTNLLHGCWC